MKEQVMVLANADLEQLGELRCYPQLVAAEQGERIWLRGIPMDNDAEGVFLKLPAVERYFLGPDNLLFLPQAVTPIAYLPTLNWKPLTEFIVPEMPLAAYGGILTETVDVKLVPSTKEEKVVALLCQLTHLQNWVESAPAMRIQALEFAVADDGNVLVMGDPLPTIPGQAFWNCEGVFLPAGWQLEYSIFASTLAKQLSPEVMEWILFQADGGWERIPKTNMVQATRSGIRQTKTTN